MPSSWLLLEWDLGFREQLAARGGGFDPAAWVTLSDGMGDTLSGVDPDCPAGWVTDRRAARQCDGSGSGAGKRGRRRASETLV